MKISENVLVILGLTPISALIAIGLSGFQLNHAVITFNQTRILELLLLAWITPAAFLYAIDSRPNRASLLRAGSATLLLLSLGLASTMATQYPLAALQDWAHYTLLSIAIIAFANLASMNLQLGVKIVAAGVVLGISLALARFSIQVILTLSMNVVTPLAQWWSAYSNPRFIAQALVWIIPMLTILPDLWPTFRNRPNTSWNVLNGCLWMLLFWTGSRAELLSLALSMALIAILMQRQAISFFMRMSLHASIGCILWLITRIALSKDIAGTESLRFARYSSSGRDWLIERSMELAVAHPWLGVGPAHFSVYNQLSSVPSAHPHNLILQIAAEWGLPAATLLLYLIWRFIREQFYLAQYVPATFDSASNIRSALKVPLLATLFAVIFASMLDGIHVMPLSELIGTPVLGLMLAINMSVENQQPQFHLCCKKGLVAALVILCWGILIFSIFWQRDCLTYPIRAERLIGGQIGNDNPRFWVQGRIPLGDGCMEIGRYQSGRDTLTGKSVDGFSTTEQYWR